MASRVLARVARYARPGGGGFEPTSGDFYAYSLLGDRAWKRYGGHYDLPSDAGDMTLMMSWNTEQDRDYAFIELHDIAGSTWTTLPDLNGSTATSTGDSCPEGWVSLHPFFVNYQDAECGTSVNRWHAFTVTDWGTQGPGVFVDDVQIPGQVLEPG